MRIDTMDRRTGTSSSVIGSKMTTMEPPSYDDPLDQDGPDEFRIIVTKRSLVRLALVAAETASRFAREKADVDPVAWMLAPRRLFDGRAAIEACLSRDECLRAVLLHGLSIGMDADPAELDALTADDDDEGDWEDDDGHEYEVRQQDSAEGGDDSRIVAMAEDGGPRPRLWTSFLVDRSDETSVQAFDAVIAGDRPEAEARLRARHGAAMADALEIVEGFDGTLPLAEALLSPALTDMLQQVAKAPASPLAAGLSVSVQQRFAA